MFSGRNRLRTQRITVGVIIGALVISLALSLLSAAGAAQLAPGTGAGASPGAGVAASPDSTLAESGPRWVPRDGSTPTPAVTEQPLIGTSGAPKPVTETPQGQATQVTDEEHLGGLIAFVAFMLGGVLLLVRGRRRDRREREAEPILS